MMPFHNIFNEWYASQTSKKVRAVWAMKAANGQRTNCNVPLGYKRDPEDQEKWLIDGKRKTSYRLTNPIESARMKESLAESMGFS